MAIDWASMLSPEVIYGSYNDYGSGSMIDPLEPMHNMIASATAMDDQVNRAAHTAAMDAAGVQGPDPEAMAAYAAEKEYRQDFVSQVSRYQF